MSDGYDTIAFVCLWITPLQIVICFAWRFGIRIQRIMYRSLVLANPLVLLLAFFIFKTGSCPWTWSQNCWNSRFGVNYLFWSTKKKTLPVSLLLLFCSIPLLIWDGKIASIPPPQRRLQFDLFFEKRKLQKDVSCEHAFVIGPFFFFWFRKWTKTKHSTTKRCH